MTYIAVCTLYSTPTRCVAGQCQYGNRSCTMKFIVFYHVYQETKYMQVHYLSENIQTYVEDTLGYNFQVKQP